MLQILLSLFEGEQQGSETRVNRMGLCTGWKCQQHLQIVAIHHTLLHHIRFTFRSRRI